MTYACTDTLNYLPYTKIYFIKDFKYFNFATHTVATSCFNCRMVVCVDASWMELNFWILTVAQRHEDSVKSGQHKRLTNKHTPSPRDGLHTYLGNGSLDTLCWCWFFLIEIRLFRTKMPYGIIYDVSVHNSSLREHDPVPGRIGISGARVTGYKHLNDSDVYIYSWIQMLYTESNLRALADLRWKSRFWAVNLSIRLMIRVHVALSTETSRASRHDADQRVQPYVKDRHLYLADFILFYLIILVLVPSILFGGGEIVRKGLWETGAVGAL